MVAGNAVQSATPHASERSLPPIAEMATGSLALIVIGGIYLAAHVPHTVPLVLPVVLLVVASVVLGAAVVMLSRVRPFAWTRFFQVFRWTLLAYVIIAGMIGYA